MRIAFVLRNYTRHGSSRYAVEVSKHFAEAGHEVHVFATQWDKIENKNIIFHKLPIVSNNFYIQEFFIMLVATIFVNLQKKNFSLVYSQPGRFFSPDIAAAHICFKAQHFADKKTPSLADNLLYFMEGYNLKKAKKIIAVSQKIKKEIIKFYGIPDRKIEVIYNGVNLNEFRSSQKYKKEIRKKYKIGNEKVLLFVGSGEKGLKELLGALPYLREKFILLVLGKHTEQFKNMVSDKINGRIMFAGYSKEINKYFAAADVFVLPTFYDSFGLVALEAMACGVPSIISKEAGVSEIIKNKKNGILIEPEPQQIAKAINILMENKILWKKIRKNSLKTAKKHTWENSAEKWLEVFKKVKK